ncbi:MAG: ABC transporter ATP-binding protein [Silanimonas sp.]
MNRGLPPLFAAARRGLFARLVLNGLAQVALGITVAMAAQRIVDRGVDGGALVPMALAIIASALGIAWLRRRELIDGETLAQGYLLALRTLLFERLTALPGRALQRRSRGATALRFVGDLNALRLWISLGVARLLVGSLVVACSLAALAAIAPSLAWPPALVIAAGAALSVFAGRHLRAATRESRRRTAHLAANVNDKIAQTQVMQAFGRIDGERRRLLKQCRRLRDATIARSRSRSVARAIAEGTVGLSAAAVLLQGAWLVSEGGGTIGALVAALSISGLLATPLRDLGRANEYRQGSEVSKLKLAQFLNEPARIIDTAVPQPLPPGRGLVQFSNVTLPGALQQFDARAEGGQRIGIVGTNGAGKSTLLALLLRLDEPQFGQILLEGIDIRDLALHDLRRAVSVVGPDFGLLRMSVLDNITYRCPNADEADIDAVLRLTGVDELARQLPQGLDTPVRDGGANLSPGQRARIALARAVLGRPRVLLLDEAETYLDPRASEALDRVLQAFDGTVLMVTHRIERLRTLDLVWHLQGGQLVETGTPGDVLSRVGPTTRLFHRGHVDPPPATRSA